MPTLARIVAASLTLLAAARVAAAPPPTVAVSVKPLHSLVAGVMAGVGEPALIVAGAASPHTYTLRPSDARLLERARVVFWVGGTFEAFLEKPLAALGARARVVGVSRAPGIVLLPARRGGAWEAHADPDGDARGHFDGGAATWDGHLWLDPGNAQAIARLAADVLAQEDPANGARYRANAAQLAARIDAVDAELGRALAPLRDAPFVVFHDAYQYFERRYALRAVGSIAVSPERSPGARRVREVREQIRRLGARCVFSEPQFPASLLGTITEGTGARSATLDPLGADLPAGPEAWFELMRGLGSACASCLR